MINKNSQPIFIIGTDTDVGKTVFSLLLIQYLFNNGYNPYYIKPFQTGCKDAYDTDSDAKFVYQNTEQLKDKDPAESVIFCNNNPKAPYFAARDDNKKIDVSVLNEIICEKQKEYNPVVLEAAGGIMVPIDENNLVIDIIKQVKAKPIIVARTGLGTINHTLLTINVLKNNNIEPMGVVFVDSQKNPTSQIMIEENMEAIYKYSGVKVSGVIKKITNFENPGEENYLAIKKLFN